MYLANSTLTLPKSLEVLVSSDVKRDRESIIDVGNWTWLIVIIKYRSLLVNYLV